MPSALATWSPAAHTHLLFMPSALATWRPTLQTHTCSSCPVHLAPAPSLLTRRCPQPPTGSGKRTRRRRRAPAAAKPAPQIIKKCAYELKREVPPRSHLRAHVFCSPVLFPGGPGGLAL